MLILYSTLFCHLCEQAFELYQQSKIKTDITQVDIVDDDALYARYGVTIPVLSWQNEQGKVIDELCWPFDLTELQQWLKKHGIN